MKLILICLFFSTVAFSQKTAVEHNLIPVQKNGKWGYSDFQLKFIIAPQYKDAYPFDQYYYKNEVIQMARVRTDESWICIAVDNSRMDCSSVEEINPVVVETKVKPKSEEKTTTTIDENIGRFITEYGKYYDQIELFYDSPLLFLVKEGKAKGIVDQHNKTVVTLNDHFIRRTGFKNQLIIQADNGDQSYFYSSTGKLILKSNYGAFMVKQDGTLWMVRVGDQKTFRIFNFETEQFINEKWYDRIIDSSFENGYLRVQRGNYEFYIDERGKEFLL